MRYLDRDCEKFVRGNYDGEALEDVVDEDPGYVRRILDEDADRPLEADEREALSQALAAVES